MATSWGAVNYQLQKDAGDEQRELEKAAKKKGLWGSIGSTLGGLGAMALTGGILNPLTVAAITGGASAAGGLIGSEGAMALSPRQKGLLTKEGGKFHKGGREDMSQTITSDILKGAATSALTAGMTKGMSNLDKGMTVMGKAPEAPIDQTFGVVPEISELPEGLQSKPSFMDIKAPEIKPVEIPKMPSLTNDNVFDMSFGDDLSQDLGDF